tara:strand:- start:798 stop:1544 length:747 start_codon:yes stop_codon:yes gene_type:complete
MMDKVFNQLESTRLLNGCGCLALIDPDVKNSNGLGEMIDCINRSNFDGILVGGSLVMDNNFDARIQTIKSNTDLPVILFPGSSTQLSQHADAILFLSLLSGRNPQFLIGEHVQSAPKIYNIGLETIPTGYILLDGGSRSSVEVMSNTNPLPMEKQDIVLAHALAGQYLGLKAIFLEAGSGAEKSVSPELVSYLKNSLSIPIIVGGGIRNTDVANELVHAGADYIVLGNILEKEKDVNTIKQICEVIHG